MQRRNWYSERKLAAWSILLVVTLLGSGCDDSDGGDDQSDGGSTEDEVDVAPAFGAECLTAESGASVACAQCMCDVCPAEVSACDDACWAAVECARPCTLMETFSEEVACIMEMCPGDLGAFLMDPIAAFDQCMIANAAEGDLRACQSECAGD